VLNQTEIEAFDTVEAIFERTQMFCLGRWLGAQVLQSSNDLLYIQHVLYSVKPLILLETGTYKGGLTYYMATVMSSVHDGEHPWEIITVDRNRPEKVFNANWFCQVCSECIKPWETPLWSKRVSFIEVCCSTVP
jgi:cephalosporin hydroxylase